MKPITLTADPALAKVAKFHDLNDGRFAVETIFDSQGIVDYAADLRAVNKQDWRGENLVATIPMPIWQALRETWRLLKLSKAEQEAALKRFVNDPDNARFRTKQGRI